MRQVFWLQMELLLNWPFYFINVRNIVRLNDAEHIPFLTITDVQAITLYSVCWNYDPFWRLNFNVNTTTKLVYSRWIGYRPSYFRLNGQGQNECGQIQPSWVKKLCPKLNSFLSWRTQGRSEYSRVRKAASSCTFG